MYLALILVTVIFLLFFLVFSVNFGNETPLIRKRDIWPSIRNSTILTSIVAVMMAGVGAGVSWDSYLDLVQLHASIKQNSDAVMLYSNKAVREFSLEEGDAELTDLKYQKYQDNLYSLITTAREDVIRYNKILSAKNARLRSKFLNWFVVAPDDYMKPIDFEELVKTGTL